MASSSSDPFSKVPQEFKDLFSWNPPKLEPLVGKKMSTKTHPLGFFDKHFKDHLKLRHVKRLPSLVDDIAAVVDKTIIDFMNDGAQFPLSNHFYSANDITRVLDILDTEMGDEKTVASFYERTTATFCLPLASTLALRNPGLLRWTQSANVDGYAIADGFLKFPGPKELDRRGAQLKEVMDAKTLNIVRSLADRNSSLSTHEFKNLAASDLDVMLAIPQLSTSPKFDWTCCSHRECGSATKHVKERDKVGEIFVGHDAKHTPWTIVSSDQDHREKAARPQQPGDVRSSVGVKRKRDDNSEILPPATHQGPELRTDRPSKKRQKGDFNVTQSTSLMPMETGQEKTAIKGKGKAQDRIDNDGDDEPNDQVVDPSYRDINDLSAQSIVQQAWAQATRVDGTIIVLQSGNYELIGIRHRDSQTLYISDLIRPHACKEPSYGKLHVGIYIAAVKDAIDRERDALPLGGEDKTLELASSRNIILLYLQYGIYDSPVPATFVRCGAIGQPLIPPPSQESIRDVGLEECLTIVLTSEIGHGATGDVLRGTLHVEASACEPLDVVVKLAFATEQRDALRNEFNVYNRLRSSGVTTGITAPLGLFDDVEGAACALVMPYIGKPLSKMPELVLPHSHRDAVLANLVEIHQADILHGDLRLNNILVADSGLILIDFSHSRVCRRQDAKNKEYSQLRSLLDRHAK